MDHWIDDFLGISEPTASGDKVRNLKPEVLDLRGMEPQLKVLREKDKVDDRANWRQIRKFVLCISVLFMGILVLLGHFKDDFQAAILWWGIMSPFVSVGIYEIFRKGR